MGDRRLWTEEEIEDIKKNYRLSGRRGCKVALERHSEVAVVSKASQIGAATYNKITRKEHEYIVRNYVNVPLPTLAEALGKPAHVVARRLYFHLLP